MNCYRCATPIPEHSRFCLSCGALVPEATLPSIAADELDDAGARELELLLRADTAGEYEILRQIGRGAMGVVYLAREMLLARDVAMKVLPPHLTYGQGAIGRFRREARTAAALEHPSIIPIYRIAPGGRLFWYTMKYLEGRSLAEVLNEQKGLPLEATITILERVGHALDYAHHRHVIHRDVKPANVMLEPHGHIVVTDFGIAKEAATGTMPGSGAILGTPFYMSPEQCRGEDLTGASDQYSVGVMAYQMLSGRVPFDSKSVVDILHKHVAEPPPPLARVSQGLPDHVSPAVERAMAKDPAERFASVTAFVRALAGPAPDATIRLPRFWSVRQRMSGTLARSPRARRRRWSWTSSLSTLAAVGLVAGAFWWSHRTPPPGPEAPRPAPSAPAPAVREPARQSVIPALPRAGLGTERGAAPRAALLVVQAVGGWAKIYTDGAFRREGSAYRDSVTAGEHRLHLERDGYESIDTTV